MAYVGKLGKGWRVQLYKNGVRQSRSFKTEALARAWADKMELRAEGMPALRALLSDHRIVPLLPRRFIEATEKANYTENEILGCAFPLQFDSGVYFLIRDQTIYYIGQTTNVLARVLKHRQSGRKFDSFAFIPCAPEHLNELEQTYITFLLPGENQRLS